MSYVSQNEKQTLYVGGTGTDPHPSKKGAFVLMLLPLSAPIFNKNIIWYELWNVPNFT